jgi:hypothetical protein
MYTDLIQIQEEKLKSCRGTSRAFAVVDDLFDFDSRYIYIC